MTHFDNGADLRDRIDHALADLAAPEHLTQGALTDGRRLRRRRRVLTGAGGVATVAAVAAFVVASLGGGSPSTDPGFATEPPAPAPKSSEKPITGLPSLAPDGPGEAFPEPPAGWWDAPSNELLEHLRSALPEGVEITESQLSPEDRAPGEPAVSAGWLHAFLAGQQGPGGFQMILYPPDLDEDLLPEGETTYLDANGDEHTMVMINGPANESRTKCGGNQTRHAIMCEEITNGDGEVIGRVNSLLQDDTITFYEATLLGPDGGLVYLSSWNATDVKPGPETPASATVPPLSLEQLRDLVQNPVWTSYQP